MLGLVSLLGCSIPFGLAGSTAWKCCPGFSGPAAEVHASSCARKALRFGGFVYSSHPASLAAGGSAQQTERRTQPLHVGSQYCRLSQLCLALCALSTPQNIPDPIVTEQIAHTPKLAPVLALSDVQADLACPVTPCDSPELPSASPCIIRDSVCYCEQVWCVILSPSHLEMVLLMKQVMVLCSSSDCGDFMVASTGLLGRMLAPVPFWLNLLVNKN